MFQQTERPLTEAERTKLGAEIAAAGKSRLASVAVISGLICFILAVITLKLSDAPDLFVVLFWVVLAVAITLWVAADLRRGERHQVSLLRASLAHGVVRETRITATELVEFEEVEDEGACWAFQVEPELVLFITGQEYYADESFPSADFSIIEPLLPNGTAVTEWRDIRGPRLEPALIIPASVKWGLEIPDHMETIHGSLDQLEAILPPQPDARRPKINR